MQTTTTAMVAMLDFCGEVDGGELGVPPGVGKMVADGRYVGCCVGGVGFGVGGVGFGVGGVGLGVGFGVGYGAPGQLHSCFW